MRLAFRILIIGLTLAFAAAVVKRDDIARLYAVLHLFDADRIVGNFSAMDAAFLSAPIPTTPTPTTPASPLAEGPPLALPDPTRARLDDWITTRNVTALVVLKEGRIVHESYHQGTGRYDLRISWSVAKSVLSALMGTVVAEGAIASIDDPVDAYAPALKGSAYEGVTIRQVLTMQSGVKFNEDYLDFNSDINRMGRVLALGSSMDGFAAGLTARDAPPGQRWHYVSIDTHVLGMVIRGATGRGIIDLMAERLFKPLGLEEPAYYVTDGYAEPFVLGGLNLATRDYARFGELFRLSGKVAGQQIVPGDWVEQSIRPQANTGPGEMGYGWQWWVPQGAVPGQEFLAQGVYGQFIYVNRPAGVVIASNAADRGFTEAGVEAQNLGMFRALAAAASAPALQ